MPNRQTYTVLIPFPTHAGHWSVVGQELDLLDVEASALHPRLDADDDNDPTVRINALTGLTCDTNIEGLAGGSGNDTFTDSGSEVVSVSRSVAVAERTPPSAAAPQPRPQRRTGRPYWPLAFSAARRLTGPKVRERVRMLSRSRRMFVPQVRPVRALMRTVGSLSSSASCAAQRPASLRRWPTPHAR